MDFNNPRRAAFVLVSTDHGTMIVNRMDVHTMGAGSFGVGHQLLEQSMFDPAELVNLSDLLGQLRRTRGDGVVVLDCGANIGTHTVSFARLMSGWGSVIAIEAQERIFYALAGNITLNNCFNARALNFALSDTDGFMRIPVPNYQLPASFGSLELRHRPNTEPIGQAISYDDKDMVSINTHRIDTMKLPRVDLIKMDIEGMEIEALHGARETLVRCRPVLLVEFLKAGESNIRQLLQTFGYKCSTLPGANLICVPESENIMFGPGGE